MRQLIVVLLVLLLANLHANESSEKKVAAEKMIDLLKLETMYKQVITGLFENEKSKIASELSIETPEESDEVMQKILDAVTQTFVWEDVKAVMVEVYAEAFTPEELKALSDFYQTPIGQNFIQKQPQVSLSTMKKMQVMVQKVTPELKKSIDAIVNEYQEKHPPKKLSQAIEATKGEDKQALFDLALMYDDGDGVEEDNEKAIALYIKAANKGHIKAMNNLALMYDEGDGVEEDNEEAVKWYTKAAEQGYSTAQYNLGMMYDEGEGISLDDEKAIYWYTKAAEQGDEDAQNNLGIMYDEGEGVKEDDKRAFYWYKKAAKNGQKTSQYYLAKMYEKGKATEVNMPLAVYWYAKSAAQGDEDAQERLDEMLPILQQGASSK
jgi:hypothetical protein